MKSTKKWIVTYNLFSQRVIDARLIGHKLFGVPLELVNLINVKPYKESNDVMKSILNINLINNYVIII